MVNLSSCLIALFLLAGSVPAANTVRADDLGRLFFSPEERTALDKGRLETSLPTPQAADATIPLENVTLNGHIKRSGGRSTVWLNGVPLREGDASKQIRIKDKAPDEVAVRLPDSSRSYPLKVGQTLTPGSGEIREGYRRKQRGAATPDVPNAAQK